MNEEKIQKRKGSDAWVGSEKHDQKQGEKPKGKNRTLRGGIRLLFLRSEPIAIGGRRCDRLLCFRPCPV